MTHPKDPPGLLEAARELRWVIYPIATRCANILKTLDCECQPGEHQCGRMVFAAELATLRDAMAAWDAASEARSGEDASVRRATLQEAAALVRAFPVTNITGVLTRTEVADALEAAASHQEDRT